MNETILALRVARRALGAAVLTGDALTLFDGRHLSGRRESAERAVAAYLTRLLSDHKPRGCVIFAPDERHDSPASILKVVQAALIREGVSLRIVRCREILAAFGHPSLRTRKDLQDVTLALLPELATVRGAIRPYVIETGACALYAQSMLGLLAGAA